MIDKLADRSSKEMLSLFNKVQAQDHSFQSDLIWQESWRHLQKRLSEGALSEMAFYDFLGPAHLEKFMGWIDKIPYPDYIQAKSNTHLIEKALQRDIAVINKLGLDPSSIKHEAIALYNVQDFLFQRITPVTQEQKVKCFLDFGAGHGRQAVLGLCEFSEIETFIAMDAIPASYLTQGLYYHALGLEVNDYLDNPLNFNLKSDAQTVNHIPSWRDDLIDDNRVDMVCAVQVLRELSKPMLLHALEFFARILKPGGALYIRDHIGFHNVNQLDLDALLLSFGFVMEWRPHVVDRVHIHGVPRIWRKADHNVLAGGLT